MIRAVRVSNEKKMRKNVKSEDVRVIFHRSYNLFDLFV